MSTASSHSPTELKAGKDGRGLSARVMDELRVLEEEIDWSLIACFQPLAWWRHTRSSRAYLRARVEEPMASGERMLLLRAEWIWPKLGLSVRSFCQQSSIS